MKRIWFLLVLSVLLLSLTMPVFGQGKGVVEHIKVHGKSLEGNLEGDSPDRDVFVYLPPSYGANRNQRYPVVYLLHGYGLTAERWMSFAALADLSDKDIAAGTMKEMIPRESRRPHDLRRQHVFGLPDYRRLGNIYR